MMWVIKGWEEQAIPVGLARAIGIAGIYTESAVGRIRYVWAGHQLAAPWPPAVLLLCLQSLVALSDEGNTLRQLI